ncbi:hypothetical protein NPIL_651821 [Nephila pilipes]|uniref:Uncharacterized protein n=1 Tax=Nephila pilipes TaxID=299642 RepID=A0A8X6U5V5_NEPPI|nr:hypothetical protein NPIL_651821 [Nephila pilipes]
MKSITQTKRNCRRVYQKDPPSTNSILRRKKNFLESGGIAEQRRTVTSVTYKCWKFSYFCKSKNFSHMSFCNKTVHHLFGVPSFFEGSFYRKVVEAVQFLGYPEQLI